MADPYPEGKPLYKVNYGGGALRIVIPKSLAHEHGIKSGDTIEWVNFQGMLCIRKVIQ